MLHRAVEPPLPVLSFGCLGHKGEKDPTQPLTKPLPSVHIRSEMFTFPPPPSGPTSNPPLTGYLPPHLRTTASPEGPYIEAGPESKMRGCASCRPLSHYPVKAVQQTGIFPMAPASRPADPVSLALSYPRVLPHSHHKCQLKPTANSAASCRPPRSFL